MFHKLISKKDINLANRYFQHTKYAQLNWEAHGKPIIKELAQEFIQTVEQEDSCYLHILKDDVKKQQVTQSDNSIYGDSITIRFGHKPLPCTATLPKQDTKHEILVETGASLVFSCGFNGSVIAMIYLPQSNVSQPLRTPYFVAAWQNSNEFTKHDIAPIFELFWQVQLFCGAYTYNRKSARIIARLEARHQQISEGKNVFISYLIYLRTFINGLRKIYGIAH
ncbi:hypothetical protein MIS46_09275 [Wielerella bovis]|uniref:hypothetical protein n=1 Tax=Wielerella bovis TaxID=2917790 RepID=UPI002018E737|nr:hypothetical protein [Wielerella bovis]ULJ59953.1 hypothetical protein MIS44_09810 [Wielerella bovis]ULJ62156.1 hypothetical protein MIS46_09275 [Wielerella bovis]